MIGSILGAILFFATQGSAQTSDPSQDCHIGIYRLQDGTFVDIGAADGGHLRWRRTDGTTGQLTADKDGNWDSTLGWTDRPDGKHVSFADCSAGRISFDGTPGQRVAFDVTETTFAGAGAAKVGDAIKNQ